MHYKSILIVTAYLALLFLSGASYATDDKTLINNAITTFNQRKASIPKLRKAAETGDKEAQFYLAETLKLESGRMTIEAQSWYEKSAIQGDMYSMFRLSRQSQDTCKLMDNCPFSDSSPETWRTTLLQMAKSKALQGDAEAMEMMYTLTGNLDWLVKSASTGYPSAQWWLAKRYANGDGWFFWPDQREKEIETLYKSSAESGYPDSISEYAAILLLSGDIKSAQYWLLKGVAIGYAPAVGTYAYNLEHGKYYHFDKNLQLAYTLNLLLAELGGAAGDASSYSLEKLKPQLTPQQIAAATEQVEEWKVTHPPISYYPPKLELAN